MRGSLFRALLATCIVATTAFVSTHASATTYRFQTVQSPTGGYFSLLDVNNHGRFYGTSVESVHVRAFILQEGVFSMLEGPTGALGTIAGGLSDDGVATGSYYTATLIDPASGQEYRGPHAAFIYDGVSYTTFTVPDASETFARGISPDGRYVSGYAVTSSGIVGFLYDRKTAQSELIERPGAYQTIAQGINSSYMLVGGDVFETDQEPFTRFEGFTYDITSGERVSHPLSGWVGWAFRAIDDNGRIAGWLVNESFAQIGFVGTPEAFELMMVPEADNTFIHGINNAGVLVGSYTNGGAYFGFIATPVPEPETWTLMLAGLAAVGATYKRWRIAERHS